MHKKTLTTLIFSAITILLTLTGCGNNPEKSVDISGIKVNLQTYRLDQEMYAIDTNHIADGLQKLNQKYPDFFNFFLDEVLNFGVRGNFVDTNSGIRESVHEYLTYHDFRDLQDTIRKCYPDTKEVDAELEKAFRYMKYYFPNGKTPRIFYINRILLKRPALCVDSTISCICLDMFLGPQFPYYASVGVPSYLAPHLRKSYIPVALFTEIYQCTFRFLADDRPLLDLMIQRGKEQYFLHKILPETPDSVLFGFTQNQVEWCNRNEELLYNFFIQQNLLFNKNEKTIIPYVFDGPFAVGIGSATDPGKPTPGNIGTWMGYKIVAAYMQQSPKTTLAELLADRPDPSKFLETARYKPKK